MRLLDLFCGAGGAAMGYHRAGFEVVGVDIAPQPHYPFQFVRCDWRNALTYEREWIEKMTGGPFDAIHASPPCQAYSAQRTAWNARPHPELIVPVRELLVASGLPYVIENVPGAPLRDPLMLCGTMFGLGAAGQNLHRHRLFEAPWMPLTLTWPCAHSGAALGVYGDHLRLRRRGAGRKAVEVSKGRLELGGEAMGIEWMEWSELREAIPPAYTEFIGRQLMEHLSLAATRCG